MFKMFRIAIRGIVLQYQQTFWQRSRLPILQHSFNMSSDVTYEELVQLQNDKSTVIIDVRDHSEIEETGKLPGSIHIPLSEVQSSLEMSDQEWKSAHGVDKPQPETQLVFSCKAGRRGQMATEKALALGFSNARNFEGGWLNWEKNHK